MIPQPVQTIRGAKDGTETSSDHAEERSQDDQPAGGCPVPPAASLRPVTRRSPSAVLYVTAKHGRGSIGGTGENCHLSTARRVAANAPAASQRAHSPRGARNPLRC